MAVKSLRVDTLQAALGIERILDDHQGPVEEVVIDHDGFLFDLIRTHRDKPEFVLPDRADMTRTTHCLRSFSRRVEKACKDRGIRVSGDLAPPVETYGHPVVESDLLLVPKGRITERGIRENIRTYLHKRGSAAQLAWAQLWQWVHHATGVLDEGRIVTEDLLRKLIDEEVGAAASAEATARGCELTTIVLEESFTMPAA
ncbi:MAG: hypothetical protein GWN47_00300 [Woeseiaceae bacterium]|nr:hypothetical protein [Woeseiaceae bacterium]